MEEQRERGRLVFEVPELQAAWISDLLRTVRLMATMLAARIGRDPSDPEVRMYTGAVMGALMASMIPTLEDPSTDFVTDLERALDFLEGGLRI